MIKNIMTTVIVKISDFNSVLDSYGPLISFIGTAGSIGAVIVTLLIYFQGIKRNNKSILQHLGLEFTVEFIIPFKEMMNALCFIHQDLGTDTDIQTIYSILERCNFSSEFPYWETHKGDVWEALMEKDGIKNRVIDFLNRAFFENYYLMDMRSKSEKYKRVQQFTQNVRSVTVGIKVLHDSIKRCLEKCRGVSTLEEYRQKSAENDHFYQKGMDLINQMQDCISRLPEELCVEKYIDRLGNQNDIKKI